MKLQGSWSPSKTKTGKHLFSFGQFDQSGQKITVDQKLETLGLTLHVITKLKGDRNQIAHRDCCPMTVEEVLNFLSDEHYNEEVKEEKDAFVSALRNFKMIRANNSLDLRDPLK